MVLPQFGGVDAGFRQCTRSEYMFEIERVCNCRLLLPVCLETKQDVGRSCEAAGLANGGSLLEDGVEECSAAGAK